MMAEKYNLSWNDFHQNVSKSFGLLRNASYLYDVTLVSDDLKQIQAHKFVLVACSQYFRSILQETKQAQPLLCLDGVNSLDLKNVLEYVYQGEVKVHQDDLNKFLAVAQKLKLEGLMSDEIGVENHEEIARNNKGHRSGQRIVAEKPKALPIIPVNYEESVQTESSVSSISILSLIHI